VAAIGRDVCVEDAPPDIACDHVAEEAEGGPSGIVHANVTVLDPPLLLPLLLLLLAGLFLSLLELFLFIYPHRESRLPPRRHR
jgi:hypothetical protein